jgi:hypothetical protein
LAILGLKKTKKGIIGYIGLGVGELEKSSKVGEVAYFRQWYNIILRLDS